MTAIGLPRRGNKECSCTPTEGGLGTRCPRTIFHAQGAGPENLQRFLTPSDSHATGTERAAVPPRKGARGLDVPELSFMPRGRGQEIFSAFSAIGLPRHENKESGCTPTEQGSGTRCPRTIFHAQGAGPGILSAFSTIDSRATERAQAKGGPILRTSATGRGRTGLPP
ncbi:hypothetical protein NDU88_006351 [Pleurodeles waltl]|uniref:Uncharacterized protein n=1 Tax=Pleurodeles waltl TaxID=8319 RepID=A0AAV7RP97_PLEWA|nr:hypothetical protein NDU88_006351 [Pleurodeles waltl]